MSTEQLSPGSWTAPRANCGRKPPFTRNPPSRCPTRGGLLVSRALDVVAAVFLALVAGVPMIVIALLVKLSSRGPIIYKQQRVGLDGKSFVIFKFRTMRVDAEVETGPIWSKRGDPRCTRVGAVLRRFSLDELPQILNVLRGEMSMVGPRPERPYFVQAFAQKYPGYNRRLAVLPGITGWAQVNGWRGDSSLEKRLDHDLYYVDHWSVPLNLRILLQTPFRMFVDSRVD